ncbi:folliculin-interacting protein 2 isoform X3 [Cardiocondyla obscurior]|uniref:folliculin-interacting protein 2 isoform X3 n=1 Tax=Cardiocondyla obscurior TaxID=286306 RepID=UPI0039658CC7
MMPLLDKLLPAKKSSLCESAGGLVSSARATKNDSCCRDSVLQVGAEQVRILLFRECEWRGRKLLFDSVTVQKRRSKSETVCAAVNNNAEEKCEMPFNSGTARDSERDKTIEDDVSLLSEMVFGTVAMTYRGSSFKVHSMNSPPCIMCTKIFPATEHGVYKTNEKLSDEGLERSHVDSTSSNTSMRSFLSRPSSGNLSSNDSHVGPRKSSTCSSTGSGWDIDIAPPTGSSQSLESNGSSGIGSLTSLRRRWWRAVSTSLGRSDSDDAFGMQHWNENGSDGRDGHAKRHKTRLGLTMLIRLVQGHERYRTIFQIKTRLLEHMALLEGMLDRLRYFCIETSNINGNCKRVQLTDRMCRAMSRFVISLLHILLNVDVKTCTPLLWHDVLLNSVTVNEMTNTLHRSLQQMCQLFDELDTKSTNFFLSTVVTAVLTYHLGWVYTVLSPRDRHMIEKLGSWYSCNPLWAQLGDLYGALGNPVKVAHTVIVGDSQKSDLINSVLSFLSYFIRSGMIRKCQEYRCTSQQDVQMATSVLEKARSQRPYLFGNKRPTYAFNGRDTSIRRRDSRVLPSRKSTQSPETETDSVNVQCTPRYLAERPRISRSVSPLKRSGTMKSGLDTVMMKSIETLADLKFPTKEIPSHENHKSEKYESENQSKGNETNFKVSSNVKIIVNEIDLQEDITSKECQPQDFSQFSLQDFEKKLDVQRAEDSLATGKVELHHRLNNNIPLKMFYNRPELPFGMNDGFVNELKESQVFFTLGTEDKPTKLPLRPRLGNNCQCSYTFTRLPSTSAQLPEGVLRKIIQRNFPESSKGIQPPPGTASDMSTRFIGFCLKCNGQGYAASQDCDNSKQVLETPTNATEVLRTCGGSEGSRTTRLSRSNSLEALIEANSVVELPMPQSRKISQIKTGLIREMGFTKTLMRNKMTNDETNVLNTGYTWGLVLQGVIKNKKRRKRKKLSDEKDNEIGEEKWWSYMREEVMASAQFPIIDQPVAEALCVLADLDTWHVGILSNNMPWQNPPLPVGMSRLVSNMLESFAYVWRKYHSPTHLGHDECCNCCCCCLPQPTCYKYVQPEVAKSFTPVRYYWKPSVPMEKNTTYRLSYWEGPGTHVKTFHPEDNLTCGDAPMSDETTQKMSYIGNWCVKTDPPITPHERRWLGKGPMEDITTHAHDYSWKNIRRPEMIKTPNNLHTPCAALSDDTTYRLSYYNSSCLVPIQSYAPIRKYMKSDVPMERCTTYRLSYWPNEAPVKEELPWTKKIEYHSPVTPMDGCTTYKLSYWPHCGEKPPKPYIHQEVENLLNANCCFDDNTTYRLSYFGCDGDKPPDPIRPLGNMIFSPCPLSHDTVNRLSFLGNWCVKPEAPITPCDRQFLGKGPMQDKTTQKHDYTWKRAIPPTELRPEGNLTFSPLPLESCTTHRLSYVPNNYKCLLPIQSYAPIHQYQSPEVPMEDETTMRLSYQPVEPVVPIEKPWAAPPPYYSPVDPMEDNTTYNLSAVAAALLSIVSREKANKKSYVQAFVTSRSCTLFW